MLLLKRHIMQHMLEAATRIATSVSDRQITTPRVQHQRGT